MYSSTRVLANPWHFALVLASCSMALAAACSQSPVIDTKESFAIDSPYHKKVPAAAAVACEGARRALLSDGYLVDRLSSDGISGRKAYRTGADQSTFIEMSVVCTAGPAGSTLYANALLSSYDVKRSTSSASLGLTAIGSVSLPVGQSADSMVKTSEETITDRDFYRRFFAAVDAAVTELQPEPATPSGLADMGRGTMPESHKTAPEGSQSGNSKDPSMQAAAQPEPVKASPSAVPPLAKPQVPASAAPPAAPQGTSQATRLSTPSPPPHGLTPTSRDIHFVTPLASQPTVPGTGPQNASEPATANAPAASSAPASAGATKPEGASPGVSPAGSTAASQTPSQSAQSTAAPPPPPPDAPPGAAPTPTP